MKKLGMIVAMTLIVTGFVFADVAFAGRVGKRQIRQQKRIHQGIHSGELTCRETLRLERGQHRLQRHKRMAWRDGALTPRERVRLEHEQDHASRYIYRMKHNDNKR